MDTSLIPLVLFALGTGIVGTAYGLRESAQPPECPECQHCQAMALTRMHLEAQRRRDDDIASWYRRRNDRDQPGK